MTVLELQGDIADTVSQSHAQDLELDTILTALSAKATLLEFSERDPDLITPTRRESLQREVLILAQTAFQYLENPVPRGYYAHLLIKCQPSELDPTISSSDDPNPEFSGPHSSLSPAPSSAPLAASQQRRSDGESEPRRHFDLVSSGDVQSQRFEQSTKNKTRHITPSNLSTESTEYTTPVNNSTVLRQKGNEQAERKRKQDTLEPPTLQPSKHRRLLTGEYSYDYFGSIGQASSLPDQQSQFYGTAPRRVYGSPITIGGYSVVIGDISYLTPPAASDRIYQYSTAEVSEDVKVYDGDMSTEELRTFSLKRNRSLSRLYRRSRRNYYASLASSGSPTTTPYPPELPPEYDKLQYQISAN